MRAAAGIPEIDEADGARLLAVRDLVVEVPVAGTLRPAVNGVSFDVGRGETVAIVGESGCGKTLVGRALVDLLPEVARRKGSIAFRGRELSAGDERAWRPVRGPGIGIVFQEPAAALDPVRTIGSQIAEALRFSGRDGGDLRAIRSRSRDLLAEVAFPDPDRGLSEYAHRLSGGQRQRAFLAIALAGNPSLLIADEPTASLDATVAADVLDLIDRLRRDRGLALLLITHDLPSAASRADRALVLYAGRVVESGPAGSVFRDPQHPYTRGLIGSLPCLALGPALGVLLSPIAGAVPPLGSRPAGACAFAPRCPERFEPCTIAEPDLYPAGSAGVRARCFLYGGTPPRVMS